MENWHALTIEKVFKGVEGEAAGLLSIEAERRLKRNGRNVLPREKPYSKLRLLLSQFNSPLMYVLFVAVVISFVLKHFSDSFFIIIVLFINTFVGFYQENKANNSLAALRHIVKIRVRVWRDGREKEIDSEELVIGDVLTLHVGDKVPADGRLIESRNLKINESSLSGEWLAVEKDAAQITEKAVLESPNMIFMGTIIEEGWGKMIVVETGNRTEFGKIVTLLRETKERKTPLQKKIAHLSRLVGAFVLFFTILIIALGYFSGKSFIEVFIASLALAVSAIPEGLLPAITIILVLGMRRILKQKGLVRKLIANETLGSVTTICTDKTGTLTEGKMQVSHILTSTKELLHQNGELKIDANGMESHITALKIAILATDAFIENPEAELEKWIVRGRPTEQALLLAGVQAGLSKEELEKKTPLIERLSFDPILKFSASLHKISETENELYVIGAPEELIAVCKELDVDGRKEKIGSSQSAALLKKFEELTAKGLRVLACAYGRKPAAKNKNLSALVSDLILAGFIALKDPLRPEAKEMIAVAKKAGIKTVIITGDHKLTAQTIAAEIGIESDEGHILEGRQIEMMTDSDLGKKVKDISIYARVSPTHKLRIVAALQARGEIVAMIGDGINDAPAMRAADIGVAVNSGTDVAKEVADLVLLDNNFKTIIKAIEQGRVIFQNIRKVFVYLVADDFSELFIFLGSMSLGLPLPLLPAQILWINLVEDGFPDVALTTEQETKGVMEEKPRDPKAPFLDRQLKKWMLVVFLAFGIIVLSLFWLLLKITGDLEKTRTIVFALLCLDSLLFSFSVRSFKRTIFRKDILSNRLLVAAFILGIVLMFLAIYFPPLQRVLDTRFLAAGWWPLIAAIGFLEIVIAEYFKIRIFRKN